MKRKKEYRMSVRNHVALSFILSLCAGCIISYGIIKTGINLVDQGEVTREVASLLCLSSIGFAILLSAIIMWIGSKHLTKPIRNLSEAVKEVAKGDFSTQIPRNGAYRGKYQYMNEIDELSENFNKMTRELDAMGYMRKDFMSNVSHEFKTPVAAITGFTEILLEGGLSIEEQKEYLTLVNKESHRLSRLCEMMLQMSKLDHQQIIQKQTTYSLDEQIRQCIIMVDEKWADRQMEFVLSLDPITITANYDLLYQVWTNLLDNAIKYSSMGMRIWVQAKERESGIEVFIQDEGCGISEEKLPRIFEKFYQCEESHRKQGSGLGLSIVRRIIELMEGTIECESKEGIGTSMKIKL